MFLIRPLRRVCREKSWPGYVICGVSREERTLILDSTRFKINRPNQFTESLLFKRKLKVSDLLFFLLQNVQVNKAGRSILKLASFC